MTHDWVTYLRHEVCYIILYLCSVTAVFNSFYDIWLDFSLFPCSRVREGHQEDTTTSVTEQDSGIWRLPVPSLSLECVLFPFPEAAPPKDTALR